MSNTFMPQIKNEADVTLESGVRIRIFRQEPFKFMNEIHKWLEGLKIGKVHAIHMNTDTNGWVNYSVAYEEFKPALPQGPDPVMVLFDAVMALKDLADVVGYMSENMVLKSETKPMKEPEGAS